MGNKLLIILIVLTLTGCNIKHNYLGTITEIGSAGAYPYVTTHDGSTYVLTITKYNTTRCLTIGSQLYVYPHHTKYDIKNDRIPGCENTNYIKKDLTVSKSTEKYILVTP